MRNQRERIMRVERALPEPDGLRDGIRLCLALAHGGAEPATEAECRILLSYLESAMLGASALPEVPRATSAADMRAAIERGDSIALDLLGDAQPDAIGLAWEPVVRRMIELRERYPILPPPAYPTVEDLLRMGVPGLEYL